MIQGLIYTTIWTDFLQCLLSDSYTNVELFVEGVPFSCMFYFLAMPYHKKANTTNFEEFITVITVLINRYNEI